MQTASALPSAWHRVVDFQPKTRRSIIGASDDDIINAPEQAFKFNVFFKIVDTTLMQFKERFSVQQLVTSMFNVFFPYRLARANNEEITKRIKKNLLSLYFKDFTEDLESELEAFANEFREEIKGKRSIVL